MPPAIADDIASRSGIFQCDPLREPHKQVSFRTVHGIGYIFDPRGVSTEGR